jgi:putative ABC transport system ATP-binding protein
LIQKLRKIFEKIHAAGNSIVLVTHEEDIAAHAARIVRLKDGLIESDRLRESSDKSVAQSES